MVRRFGFLALATAGLVLAQDPPARIGRLSYATGAVSFEPAGVTDWVPATVNRPLTIGDQLFADEGGRAEVRVPGTAFRLGSRTAFEFMNLDDRNVQVRLSEGTLDLRVRRLDSNIEVDAPNLAFTVTRPGEYRLDANADSGETYVTVRDGEGQVTGSGGAFAIRSGQQAIITGQDQNAQYNVYEAPGYDDFDNWVVARNRREDRYAQPRYVSPEMVGYEDLDEYGSWRSAPGYGEMWVPRDVSAGWAPYRDGHWAWVDPWGWTWVDDQPWGFAPFHYGRWAYVGGTWGWCPGPVSVAPVYSPALVAWVGFGGGAGVSLEFGGGPAVGWFPLGPRDVYIPAYRASPAYVNRVNVTNTTVINNTYVTNVYNTYQRTNQIPVNTYMNRSVPNAVVAVPQTALTNATAIRQVARPVSANQLAAVRTVMPAPRVAPQVASVLGHPVSAAAHVPRPPAAVITRTVVAKTAPPPARATFQQRQAVLEQNPGRPVPLPQLAAAARTSAAPRPPVQVVAQARPVTPRIVNAPAPRTAPATANNPAALRPGVPARTANQPPRPEPPVAPPAQPRAYEPPAATQRHEAQPPVGSRVPAPVPATQPNRPNEPPTRFPVPNPAPQPNRTYEPPSAQRPTQPAPRTTYEQPRPTQAPRPVPPPATQRQQPATPPRPAQPVTRAPEVPQNTPPRSPDQQQSRPVPPQRTFEPPSANRQERTAPTETPHAPARQARPPEAPQQRVVPPAQPSRPENRPAPARPAEPAPRPQTQARPAAPPPRPAPQERREQRDQRDQRDQH
ncbi:MAG: DUF6600 domain-containing protein [Bryobacteraceae bacterium]